MKRDYETKMVFFVHGIPKPGGSKTGFCHPHAKNKKGNPLVIVVDACKGNKPWRKLVEAKAREVSYGYDKIEGPVKLHMVFHMPRPKAHYRTGKYAGELKDSAPHYHTNKPDATKLLRAAEDALTDAEIWNDDSQVVEQAVEKIYGPAPGVLIEITRLSSQ